MSGGRVRTGQCDLQYVNRHLLLRAEGLAKRATNARFDWNSLANRRFVLTWGAIDASDQIPHRVLRWQVVMSDGAQPTWIILPARRSTSSPFAM